MIVWIAAVQMIALHSLSGQVVLVNPKLIVSLLEAGRGKVVTEKANCIVTFTNGKFVSVLETCAQVRARMEQQESELRQRP